MTGPVLTTAPDLVVDVAGKVRRPGIYRLAAGARVYEALQAAGGVQPGVATTQLNLAARVSDGEQIVVGLPGVPGAAATVLPGASGAGGGTSQAGAQSATVSLNAASQEQLESLPGVGPVLAQHILDWRSQHGPFASIDQLRDVSGIGEIKYAALKPRVTL
ncbi:MAG: helix-hairpin-helix domain-containing protein [Jatrophihabitantaceae bacterium]